jgi:hypothetical protein
VAGEVTEGDSRTGRAVPRVLNLEVRDVLDDLPVVKASFEEVIARPAARIELMPVGVMTHRIIQVEPPLGCEYVG